jgi:hypothetical protein
MQGLHDFLLRHRNRSTAAVAKGAQDFVRSDRALDGCTFRNRWSNAQRARIATRMSKPAVKRRAVRWLHAKDPGQSRDRTSSLQLLKGDAAAEQ